MPSNHFILCRPLLLLPSIFPSIRIFSNESAPCIRWPKYWNLSFSIHPSNEHSELISFRINWFDLLAVQETLKSLLQHHSSKASILWSSAFFMVQLSLPYVTTGKTVTLTIWMFVGKMLSLFFNTLSRFVMALLPSSTLRQNHPEKGRSLPQKPSQVLFPQKVQGPAAASSTDSERASSSPRCSRTQDHED